MALDRNEERIHTFPDLIVTLDAKNGNVLTSAEIKQGQEDVYKRQGFPRVLGIVAPYTGREIETHRYCSRLVLPVEG